MPKMHASLRVETPSSSGGGETQPFMALSEKRRGYGTYLGHDKGCMQGIVHVVRIANRTPAPAFYNRCHLATFMAVATTSCALCTFRDGLRITAATVPLNTRCLP